MFHLSTNNSFLFSSSFPQFPHCFYNPLPYIAMSTQFSQSCKGDEYQKHYKEIYESMKEKYKKQVSSSLSLEEVGRCSSFLSENQSHAQESSEIYSKDKSELKMNKLYCFLSTLTFFEVDSKKSHEQIVSSLIHYYIKKN